MAPVGIATLLWAPGPPSPAVIAALEVGLPSPFRDDGYNKQVPLLKKERGYIARITVAKARINVLGYQVVLSGLFGLASFIAQYLYGYYGFDEQFAAAKELAGLLDVDADSESAIEETNGTLVVLHQGLQQMQQGQQQMHQEMQQGQQQMHQDLQQEMQQMHQGQQQMLQLMAALLNATLAKQ